MEGPVFAADIRVVEARFRRRDQEVVINLRGNVEIAIDSAVNEFDFQSMQPLAVTNRSEGGGSNGLALDVRSNTRRIRRLWRIAYNGGREQEHACAQRNGGTHGILLVAETLDRCRARTSRNRNHALAR